MSLWVMIPVKPLNRAKSRLSDVLTPEQRYQFSEAMFKRLLAVVKEVTRIAGTLVISRDPKVLAIAREFGAKTVQEGGAPELNVALARGVEVVKAWGAEAVFVLPADLPFVNAQDLAAIIDLGAKHMSVVIASDYERDGTNALLLRPPDIIKFQYGKGSFERHIALAHEVGATVHTYESERILLDIDVPSDLIHYNQLVQTGHYKMLPLLSLNDYS